MVCSVCIVHQVNRICPLRLVAAGSDDMSTRIYPIQDMSNFGVTSLGGHSAAVLAVFFEKDSLDCYTLSRSDGGRI